LPHPYTRRLYRQRGVFIHTPKPAPSAIRRECIEVHFPPAREFTTYRQGKPIDLLRPDPWIESLVAEARAWVSDSEGVSLASKQIENILGRLRTSGVAFPHREWEDENLVELLAGIQELLSDLATIGGEFGFRGNRAAIDILTADNLVFVKHFVDLNDAWLLADGVDLRARRKDSLIEVMRANLRRHGVRTNTDLRALKNGNYSVIRGGQALQ
jgi:hypothetical protein